MAAFLQGAEELEQSGLQKPVLGMYASRGWDLTLFGKATQDAVWFQISNTEHLSFSTATLDHVVSKMYWIRGGRELPHNRLIEDLFALH